MHFQVREIFSVSVLNLSNEIFVNLKVKYAFVIHETEFLVGAT